MIIGVNCGTNENYRKTLSILRRNGISTPPNFHDYRNSIGFSLDLDNKAVVYHCITKYTQESLSQCTGDHLFAVDVTSFKEVLSQVQIGDYKVVIDNPNKIQVGCQEVSFDQVEKIYEKMCKLKKEN